MVLIAEKPFKYRGRTLDRGDTVDPTPDGRLLHQLLDQRKARWADGVSHRDVEHAKTSATVTYPCADCGRVLVSAAALDAHRSAAHPDAVVPMVSVSPDAPEPAAVPSVAAAGVLSCPDCARTFNGAQGLKVHRSRAHAGA